MLKLFYNLFLHTNSLFICKINLVKFLNNLLDDIFQNVMSYRFMSKVKKDIHTLLVYVIIINHVKQYYNLFVHTHLLFVW